MTRLGLMALLFGLITIEKLNITYAFDRDLSVVYYYVYPGMSELSEATQNYFDDVISEINDDTGKYKLELRSNELDSSAFAMLYLDVEVDMEKIPEVRWDLTTTLLNTEWLGTAGYLNPSLAEMNAISPLLLQDHNPAFTFDTYFVYTFDDQISKQVLTNYLTGLALYASGDCLHAAPYFVQAQEMNVLPPENTNLISSASFYLGNCSIVAGDWQAAASFYKYGLSTSGLLGHWLNDFGLQANLAWVYMSQGRKDDALRMFDQMIELTDYVTGPDLKIYPYFLRTQLLASHSDYQAAIESANEAIAFAETDVHQNANLAILYILRGQMYLALYEWDSALADYNAAIELDPDYADAYYERGVLYYSILQTGVELRADALADFRHYLELAPEGDKAADAARYAEQIETELDALNS